MSIESRFKRLIEMYIFFLSHSLWIFDKTSFIFSFLDKMTDRNESFFFFINKMKNLLGKTKYT